MPEPSTIALAPAGPEVAVPSSGLAGAVASSLLRELGVRVEPRVDTPRAGQHPDLDWAASGAMSLTGHPDGPPLLAPAPLATRMNGVIAALRGIVGGARWTGGELDGAALLGERAAIFGYERRGATAPGGSCRLLETADGWIAINLARDDDRALLPAWLAGDESPAAREPGLEPATLRDPERLWPALRRHVARLGTSAWVERGRLMGLPVAPGQGDGRADDGQGEGHCEGERMVVESWLRLVGHREGEPPTGDSPLVLDLSSLWAGPLCGHLFGLAGARVIKVEGLERPDGARRGPAAFFDLMNAGKSSVALPLRHPEGVRILRALIDRADVVIESTRPRALAQLGIDARRFVRERDGLSWVSVTGYGRREPQAGWVAFGDDAAAAAGLAAATGRMAAAEPGGRSRPVFCGDAIADPLTGAHAALAGWVSWRRGGSRLLDVSLRAVTAAALAQPAPAARARVEAAAQGYAVGIADHWQRVAAPRARESRTAAAALGADTEAVLEELMIPCGELASALPTSERRAP